MATSAPSRRTPADMLARWFARQIAGTPDDRLERAMRGPRRGVVLWQVFRAMPRQLNRDRARDVEAVIDYRIRGRADGGCDHWQAVISEGRCRITHAPSEPATVTLDIDAVPFLKLVTGNATGPELFMTGKLNLEGDIALATRLPTLFRIPTAAR